METFKNNQLVVFKGTDGFRLCRIVSIREYGAHVLFNPSHASTIVGLKDLYSILNDSMMVKDLFGKEANEDDVYYNED